MKLLLGTHEPCWLGRSPLPLFVSMARASRFPRQPRHHAPGWCLDSGGFTAITAAGGWTTSPTTYIEQLTELDERVSGMRWAAPQDWMCEPKALAATGLTVAEHQHRTVDNYCELSDIDQQCLVIPVLQGWAPGDHERCADMYAAAGVDLAAAPVVGIGTICRHQDTAEIESIVRSLATTGWRLHGFGVKTLGLARYGHLLHSADSLAWSDRARNAWLHERRRLGSGCTHNGCANCYRWAHEWHASVPLEPAQLELAL